MVIPSRTAVGLGSAGQLCVYMAQCPAVLVFWLSKLENTVELTMIFSCPLAKKSRGCREVVHVHASSWEQGITARSHSTFCDCWNSLLTREILPLMHSSASCFSQSARLPSSAKQMSCSIKCFRPVIPFRVLFSSSRQVLVPVQTWLSLSLCLSLQCYLSPHFEMP